MHPFKKLNFLVAMFIQNSASVTIILQQISAYDSTYDKNRAEKYTAINIQRNCIVFLALKLFLHTTFDELGITP